MTDIAQIRILVVDDHAEWRAFVVALLKGKGVNVIDTAATGLEAVKKAAELEPTLILMDIGLPDLSGFEAAQRIRTVAPRSRVLFVTCYAGPDFIDASLAAGGRGCVLKSQAPSELLAAIQFALRDEPE